jgi:predicted dehydrogenase
MAGRSRPLGLGFVGAGTIARERHVPGFRALPRVELVAVATSSLASAEAVARDLGFRRAHARWRDIIHDPDVDAVVVTTWPDLHATVTVEALRAGRHVLTEGRMAADLRGASRMLAAARARPDLAAMVVPGAFSFWADGPIRRLLDQGSLGTLRGGRLTWAGGVSGVDPWRRLRRTSGINTMAVGIVYEALVRWLGQARWVSAATAIREPTMPGPDGRPVAVDVPDHVLALVGFPDDLALSLEVTADERPDAHSLWLHGSEATLHADFDRRRLELVPVRGRSQAVPIARAERRRWTVEADFVAAIREGRPVTLNDFATAWHGMAFTDAIHRSAATGRRMAIADVP